MELPVNHGKRTLLILKPACYFYPSLHLLEVEAISFSAEIRAAIRRYLKWYSVPLVYFLLTSLVCAHAWYTRPISYRAGIKIVFEKLSVMPTLALSCTITVWIVIAVILIPISFWLKRRFPETSVRINPANLPPAGFWKKTVNISLSVLGVVLIGAGLSMATWISRPYITFLFSTSKIETLEKKAELLGEVLRDDIGKGKALEKTEFTGKIKKDTTNKSEIIETVDHSEQVQGDVIKKNEAIVKKAELTGQVQRDTTNKSGLLAKFAELRQRDITRR